MTYNYILCLSITTNNPQQEKRDTEKEKTENKKQKQKQDYNKDINSKIIRQKNNGKK